MIQFAAFFAGVLIIQRLMWREKIPRTLGITTGYFFALLGFVFVSYVTRRQPSLYPRYGLLFFVLGTPLLAWILDNLSKASQPLPFRTMAAYGLILLSVRESTRQLAVLHSSLESSHVESAIARELQFSVSRDSVARPVFCDQSA